MYSNDIEALRAELEKGLPAEVRAGLLSKFVLSGETEHVRLLLQHIRGLSARELKYGDAGASILSVCEDADMLRVLLEEGNFDVNQEDCSDRPPLYDAVRNNRKACIALLLEHGARAYMRDGTKWTWCPVELAIKEERTTEGLRRLLDGDEGLLADEKQCGKLLALAVDRDKAEHLEELLNRGVSPDIKLQGDAPLHKAVRNGQDKCVDVLVRAGADINILNWETQTPLNCLCRTAHNMGNYVGDDERWSRCLALLLAADCDLERPDRRDRTPLYHTIDRYHWRREQLQQLLDAGIDVNTADQGGKTVLHHHLAKGGGTLPVLLQLSKHGADIQAVDDGGNTLAHAVAEQEAPANLEYPEALEELIAQGVDIGRRNKAGYTPMQRAVVHARPDLVRVLIRHGQLPGREELLALTGAVRTKPGSKQVKALVGMLLDACRPEALGEPVDDKGNTLLHVCCRCAGNTVIEQLLARDGVDVDARNRVGETPLMALVRNGKVPGKAVGALLSQGAHINATAPDGRTALDLLRSRATTGVLPDGLAGAEQVLLEWGGEGLGEEITPAPGTDNAMRADAPGAAS